MGSNVSGVRVPQGASRRGLRLSTLVFLAPVAAFIYLSTRPVMHLKVEPPAAFHATSPKWKAAQRSQEDRLAKAYWERAVEVIQWQHPYASKLPADPPAEFQIDETLAASSHLEKGLVSREVYWRRLVEVWPNPDIWNQVYGWNTDWARNGVLAFRDGVTWFVEGVMARLRH